MRVLVLLVLVVTAGCSGGITAPSMGPTATPSPILRSCADFPPGQFPAGNPGNGDNGAPGNSSTNDHDCHN